MVQDEGALTAAIPQLEWLPSLATQWAVLPHLASTVIAIAIIGMLEATAITKSLAAKSGQALEPNQELLGMGVGNMAARALRGDARLLLVHPVGGQLPERRDVAAVLHAQQRGGAADPVSGHAGLQLHPGGRPGGPPDARGRSPDQQVADPGGPAVHAVRCRGVRRHPWRRALLQARDRHLRGHRHGAGAVSAEDQHALAGRIRLQRERPARRVAGSRRRAPIRRSRSSTSRASCTSAPPTCFRRRSGAWRRTPISASSSCG